MQEALRKKFTIWYVKKGYYFGYEFSGAIPKAYWICPSYIRPFLFLFSPSVYQHEAMGKAILEGFEKGLRGDPLA